MRKGTVRLRGMTWRHPRAVRPLLACSEAWLAERGVAILWDQRSLQDFETYPLATLARNYDLLVIDHPHVGQAADEGCLLPFGDQAQADELDAIAQGSIGPSFESYRWAGAQWALPIDAAAQVQAWRPNLIAGPPRTWDEALGLLRERRALVPLRPPHVLMTFFSLCEGGCDVDRLSAGGNLVDAAAGLRAYDLLDAIAQAQDAAAYGYDPIDVLDLMSAPKGTVAVSPMIYGYSTYAQATADTRLSFADLPGGARGSVLGGTGIAVSASTSHPDEATDFATSLASGPVQQGVYAVAGGQPAHEAAWSDDVVNRDAGGFYAETRRTLDRSWLRPRHHGYMALQAAGSDLLLAALRSRTSAPEAVDRLNALFRGAS